MKIPIEVNVIMPQCKDCPRFEIETISMTRENLHRCKHVQLCRRIIQIWEQAHPESKKEGGEK